MADNEIIKALECCTTASCGSSCPRWYDYGMRKNICENKISRDALALINRQKAEIERLDDVVYRLTLHNNSLCLLDETQKKAIKSEAIKEFADRLKERCTDETTDNINNPCVRILYDAEETIDNLVKEMVGEQE